MSDVDTSRPRRRKKWSEKMKREIVAATLVAGASVSVVARQFDVNANQVFSWRRRHLKGGALPPASLIVPGLVPVRIAPEAGDEAAAAPSPVPAVAGVIEIEIGGDCRIRVGSSFDSRALKRVIDVLRTR